MRHTVARLYHFGINSPAVWQSAIMTVGNMVTAVISAVALIYLSRVLGPAQFGIFSVASSLMMILCKVGDLGLNAVVTRYVPGWQNQDKKVHELLGQLVLWKLGLVAGGFLLGLLALPMAMEVLQYPYLGMLLWALAGSIVIVIYEYVLVVLSAYHQFTWASVLSSFQAAIKVVAFVSLGMTGALTVMAATTAYVLAPLVSALVIMIVFPQWFLLRPKPASVALKKVIKNFSFHAGLGVIAMTLIVNVDVLFVQTYLTPFETGVYAGAARIAMFVGFATAAIGGVLNNRVARYQENAQLRTYLKKSSLVSVLAIMGAMAFLPVAKWVLTLSIGPEYISGLVPMTILVLNAFWALAVVPYVSFFYAVEYPSYFSIGGVLQVVIIVIGNVLFLEQYGLDAAAWSRVVATVFHSVYTLIAVWWVMKHRLHQA
ncbi:MAG TPA: oligosaccharide flippase family protein [Vitreimonas sp.]|nr:oligosaccharide flippase family protein [Vitreimonas sp.]